MIDAEEEEFAEWDCAEEREAAVRYRPGNRFVPGFVDLVDRRCRWFWLRLADDSVGWAPEEPRERDALTVVVEVAYRAAGSDADVTASCVWDSAVLLSRYLARHHARWSAADRAVELGAGCGLVGLSWATLTQKPVVLTDLPSSLERLRANLSHNEAAKAVARVEALRWGDCDTAERLAGIECVLVLAADCLLPYSESAMRALAATIVALLRGNRESVALVAYEERCSVAPFMDCVGEGGLKATLLETWDKGTLRLLQLSRQD